MKALVTALFSLVLTATAAAADPVGEFSLPDLEGRQQTLAAYQGKWIVINYWATDCPPCLKEIPELERFYQAHKDRDAVVIGVNYEDIKLSWLRDFISSVEMTYPVVRAEPNVATPFGMIQVLPTTVFVSPQGKLMGVRQGAVTAKMIEDYINDSQAEAQGDA